MTPNFTNINLILNTLYEFWEQEFAFDYSEALRTSPGDVFLYSPDEHVKAKVEYYDALFTLAEGEITHNIFAGNTLIINSLFHHINSHRNHIYPNAEALLEKIKAWNNESYKTYEKDIEEKADRYFDNDKFTGLKHLDTFDDYRPENPFDMRSFKHVTRTYYAYYCVEHKWEKYFDLSHFDSYYSFLVVQIDKIVALFDKYIQRYEAGEFTKKEEEKVEERTLQEKVTKWAENNKIIVVVVIAAAVLTFGITQWENIQKIMGWVQPKGKDLSGIVMDEAKNRLIGVQVTFGNDDSTADSTDSFGKFQFSGLQGEGVKSETVWLKRSGYRDTSFVVKINYNSEEKLEPLEIRLKVKSDLDFCIEGDVQACYRYAESIYAICPPNEGQARAACIFKAEMWRAVGDDYQDVLNFKRDSGEASGVYKEAVRRWLHQIEMANAMPDW